MRVHEPAPPASAAASRLAAACWAVLGPTPGGTIAAGFGVAGERGELGAAEKEPRLEIPFEISRTALPLMARSTYNECAPGCACGACAMRAAPACVMRERASAACVRDACCAQGEGSKRPPRAAIGRGSLRLGGTCTDELE